ncbi:MAG: DUF4878 domain-containing protein [Bacteroidaceae bacterium]|nr:DUF4878 domain-containing protein [Bacteroidaceae bacterium]
MMSLILGTLLMVNCGGNGNLTAEESVVKFLEAIQDKDVDAVYSFLDHGRYDKDDVKEEMHRNDGIKRFEIVDAEEDGSRARVKAKIKYKDGESATLTFRLNKKSQGWVIIN